MPKKNNTKIEFVDFGDQESNNIIKKYCLHSAPFDQIHNFYSISCRDIASENFLDRLKEKCQLSIAAKSEEDYLFFTFFKKDKGGFIDLYFAMPNTNLNLSADIMRHNFYSLCLYAIDHFSMDNIEGLIYRKNKKNSMKLFFKRYIKAMTYKENEDLPYDSVYLTKESILNHREKLQVQSNRNKLDDKTPRT